MNITHITDAPRADQLWARGNTDLLQLIPAAITITGSRASTAYGNQVAGDLAHWLTKDDRTILTGGSYGIEVAAIAQTLADEGTPIVVLPCGLDRVHPAGNRPILENVVKEGGLLVSLEEPGTAPTRETFIRRAAWMGAVTAGTIIVEAAARAGALVAAQAAELAGLPIGAVPGPITGATSHGTHQLIQQSGAHVIYDQHSAQTFARTAVTAAAVES